jgi:hypothetical protein
LFLIRCAIAANPPVTFALNAGVTCDGFCLGGGIQIQAVTTDAAGNVYATGNVNLTTFPATPNAFQRTLTPSYCVGPPLSESVPPCNDAFVVKLDPGGNIVWATYLGGNGDDYGSAIAVDAGGNVFVAGTSEPGESAFNDTNTFPITSGAPFGPPAPSNAGYFVTKLSADGSRLFYSTFLPGRPVGVGAPAGNLIALAIDSAGNAYLTFQDSPNAPIPTTAGAFQPTPQNQGPGVVLKLNASGSALIYATYLSGSGGQDFPASIAVDDSGNAVIAGNTQSTNFPVTPGAFETTIPDPAQGAGFASKLSSDGTTLVYSTYFGYQAKTVKLDSSGDAYILGVADPGVFPSTSGPEPSGTISPIVARLSADDSSLVYSIFVPDATSIDVERAGSLYVAGQVFVKKIAPDGTVLGVGIFPGVQSTGLTELVAAAPNGSVVISGSSSSTDFPVPATSASSSSYAYVAGFLIEASRPPPKHP